MTLTISPKAPSYMFWLGFKYALTEEIIHIVDNLESLWPLIFIMKTNIVKKKEVAAKYRFYLKWKRGKMKIGLKL